MKLLAAISLLAFMFPPPQDYPVHWKMIDIQFTHRDRSIHGEGRANISEEGQPTRAFDFTFDNCRPFHQNTRPDLRARWVGNDHIELVILRSDLKPVGMNTKEECILTGKLQHYIYLRKDDKIVAMPLPTIAPTPATPAPSSPDKN